MTSHCREFRQRKLCPASLQLMQGGLRKEPIWYQLRVNWLAPCNHFHNPLVSLFLSLSPPQVIPNPKPRSSRWISTSIPETQWQTELAQNSSAEYHVNNLVSPVLFQEGLRHIPENAVVVEIAPHALLQVLLLMDRMG